MPKKPRLINDLPGGPSCSGCPYQKYSRGFTPPVLRPESLYVIMGEASGYWEIHEETPFAGVSGSGINEYLDVAGLTRLDCSLLNTCSCRPIQFEDCPNCDTKGEYVVSVETLNFEYGSIDEPTWAPCLECAGEGYIPKLGKDGDHKNATPEPGQILECMERYGHDNLRSLTHKRLIIAAGANPLFALTGYSNLGDYRGSVVETSHGPALITYHPAFVKRDGRMEPVVRRDYSRIPAIVSGNEGRGLEINYVREPTEEQFNELRLSKSLVMDLETTGGLDPLKGGNIKLGSVSRKPGEGFIVSVGERLRTLLQGLDTVIGQNFYSYDAWWLHHRGYRVPETIIDTKPLAHLANPATPNDLTFIQSQYAEPPMSFWKSRENYSGDIELVALQDVDGTKRSELGLVSNLKRENQWELAERVIIPWCRLAFELRRDGIRVDVERLDSEGKRISNSVFERGRNLSERTGVPLPNKTVTGIPSYQAIKKHLYGTLGLPTQYHPKTGKVTTDQPRLKRLWRWCKENERSDGVGFIESLLGQPDIDGEWSGGLVNDKDLAKDMRKFARAGMDEEGLVFAPKVQIHTEPYITGTETGRLSWELLHQVPPACRHAILPDPGHVLLQFDYRQLELLVMLYEAEEWELLDRCINDGYDFHTMTAADFYNKPYDVIHTKRRDLRKAIKPVSLGRLYGKGVESTALDMDMSRGEVSDIFDRYDEIIPGLSRFQEVELETVRRRGYIQTEYGWRRYFTGDEQKNVHRNNIATQAYNTRIQSNAGMRTREALVDIWRELKREFGEGVGADARVLLSVHDSGLFSVNPAVVERVSTLITELATGPTAILPAPRIGMPEGVRFPIDLEIGNNWGELVKWESYTSGEWIPNTQ